MLSRYFAILDEKYGQVNTFLNHRNEFELLIAVILSAQTTDLTVNKVTPRLFERYPTAEKLADAEYQEVTELIRHVNYYRNKAKYLIASAKIICSEYDGVIPRSMSDLIRLPGVGRKVANVLMAEKFDMVEGFVVDTHVKRVAFRLGWTQELTPVGVERDLMKLLPRERWVVLPKQLILIGREYCYAGRKPDCGNCPLRGECAKIGVSGEFGK